MSVQTKTPTAPIAPTTPKVEETASKLKPTPKIEPTPQEIEKATKLRLELQVEDTLSDIQLLTQLSKQYNTTDFTLERLKEFEFGLEEEENYGAILSIRDSKRKEFDTKNPRLIEALVKALKLILVDKKTELSNEIAKVKISL